MNGSMKLWAADPHRFGPGKVHIVDEDNSEKTLCGKFLAAMPGSDRAASATCKICLDAVVRRPENERMRQEGERRRAEADAIKAEERRQWWEKYNAYLSSPEWAALRRKVLARAGGVCEGCGVSRATQVHHVTYVHVFNEFLWELRAICEPCHDRVTDLDRQARS